MRRAVTCLLLLVAAIVAPAGAQEGPEFADWTAKSADGATGTLLGAPVSITGPIQVAGTTVIGGWQFLRYFTPPLEDSDAIATQAPPSGSDTFAVHFGTPVRDPVFHLASLGSVLTFPPGTVIERLSTQDPPRSISVAGNVVTGSVATTRDANGDTDGNGTIRLDGTFTDVSFTAALIGPSPGGDGHSIQIGGSRPVVATPTPTPSPTPTPEPSPEPVSGVRAVTAPASGTVLVRRGGRFVPLTAAEAVPVGAVVDARKGEVAVTTSPAPGAEAAVARIRAGIFQIKQRRGHAADLVLVTPRGKARACAARRKGVVRQLVVRAKGAFRTIGKRAVVKGRNATWTTRDRCDGTQTKVSRGRVTVRAAKKTVRLRAHQSYLVKARLFGAKKRRR